MSARWSTIVFSALVTAVAGFFAVMAYLEPTLHDVWHFHHYSETQTFPEYVTYMYFESDARIGNLFAYFVCSSTLVHMIWTPIVMLLFFGALFAVAFGRWPRPSDARDSFRLFVLVGLYWIAIPFVGVMTFYRPFSTMYVHAFCLLLLIVVIPYRFALEAPGRTYSVWWTPVMLLAGFVAGFTNEQTLPTTMVAIVAALWLMRRRGQRWAPWMIAGLVGVAIGFLFLFFAPAQDLRYDGLATKTTITERILHRGFRGNFRILWQMLGYAKWVALAIVAAAAIAFARGRFRGDLAAWRRQGVVIGVLVAAALMIAITMLASPIQAYRLMFASNALLMVAGLVALDLLADDRLVRGALVAAAGVIIAVHCYVFITMYSTAHREYEERLALMRAAKAAGVRRPTIPAYSYQAHTRWFYGDDFARRISHNILRRYWGMKRVNYVPRAEYFARDQATR